MGEWFRHVLESTIRRVDLLLHVVPKPEPEGGTMSANFRGIKQQGDSPADGAIATWSFRTLFGVGTPGAPDAGPLSPNLPNQVAVSANGANFPLSYKWVLDIQAVQGSYDFGPIKKLRINLSKLRSWISGDNKWFISGRVWVYIPLTNELFTFSDDSPLAYSVIATAPADNPETWNREFDVNLPRNATIEVWVESDIGTGNFVTGPAVQFVLNAYNRR